jgi:hypothetical protein
MLKKISLVLFLGLFITKLVGQNQRLDSADIQPPFIGLVDSTKVFTTNKKDSVVKPFKINPKLATKKSAIIPGWGQAYAKQYWFIPIIYAGFGASTFGILYNGKRYRILRSTYLETSAKNATDASVTTGKITLNNKEYELSIANLKQYTSYFRRNRDLSWLSIPVVWAVNVLEINVAAHLKSFDMTDDITLKLEPSFAPNPFSGMPTVGGKMVFALR